MEQVDQGLEQELEQNHSRDHNHNKGSGGQVEARDPIRDPNVNSIPEQSCGVEGHERKSHHSDRVKGNLTTRLNRIEGQIRGLKGMIEKDTYCDDVLNQLAAVQSALNSVGKLLLEHHMNSCVIERIQEGDREVVKELMITMNKLIK